MYKRQTYNSSRASIYEESVTSVTFCVAFTSENIFLRFAVVHIFLAYDQSSVLAHSGFLFTQMCIRDRILRFAASSPNASLIALVSKRSL